MVVEFGLELGDPLLDSFYLHRSCFMHSAIVPLDVGYIVMLRSLCFLEPFQLV